MLIPPMIKPGMWNPRTNGGFVAGKLIKPNEGKFQQATFDDTGLLLQGVCLILLFDV